MGITTTNERRIRNLGVLKMSRINVRFYRLNKIFCSLHLKQSLDDILRVIRETNRTKKINYSMILSDDDITYKYSVYHDHSLRYAAIIFGELYIEFPNIQMNVPLKETIGDFIINIHCKPKIKVDEFGFVIRPDSWEKK